MKDLCKFGELKLISQNCHFLGWRAYCKFIWRSLITMHVYQMFYWYNQKIWSVVYINSKWIYASKSLACTIRDCKIVRSVLCVTSTCLFIYWCSGSANIKWTPWFCYSCLDSVKVNCVPASAEIISKFHYRN